MLKTTNEPSPSDEMFYQPCQIEGDEGAVIFEDDLLASWLFTCSDHSFVLPDNWRI